MAPKQKMSGQQEQNNVLMEMEVQFSTKVHLYVDVWGVRALQTLFPGRFGEKLCLSNTPFNIPSCYRHQRARSTLKRAVLLIKSVHVLMLSFQFILPMPGYLFYSYSTIQRIFFLSLGSFYCQSRWTLWTASSSCTKRGLVVSFLQRGLSAT